MNIYYNPLDVRCKSTIGGIEQNQKLHIRVYGKCTEPCLFVLHKDGQSGAQYLHMDTVADGWSLLLNLQEPGLYFYHFNSENSALPAAESSAILNFLNRSQNIRY